MKANIHPNYNKDIKVSCSCGATFQTGSTLGDITTEICSKCHPFFTGEMRFVDTQGRVEKFEAARKKAQALMGKKSSKKVQTDDDTQEPKTLKEIMEEVAKGQPSK